MSQCRPRLSFFASDQNHFRLLRDLAAANECDVISSFGPARGGELARVSGAAEVSRLQLSTLNLGNKVDLIVSWGFPYLLPGRLLATAGLGGINVHYSHLPKYRGPIPLHWAIRGGDATAGISIHRMADQYDSGKILYSGHGVTIPSDPDFRQVISAYERIVPLAVTRAISRALMEEEGTPQSGPIGSQGWMRPEFLWVHQSAGVESVHNQVRTFRFGTSGRQGPIAYVDGAWIELLQTARTASINSTQMRCADGYLYIEQSRPARFSISPPGWIRD